MLHFSNYVFLSKIVFPLVTMQVKVFFIYMKHALVGRKNLLKYQREFSYFTVVITKLHAEELYLPSRTWKKLHILFLKKNKTISVV